MYLSSKRAACVGLGALVAGLGALAAGSASAAGPGVAPGMAHPVAPRLMHVGPGPGQFPRQRIRRGLYGYGLGGGFGFGGQSVATYPFDGGPPPVAAAPEPPPIPPQPACPMVIKVGPGLDHPVQSRVIYGRPAC